MTQFKAALAVFLFISFAASAQDVEKITDLRSDLADSEGEAQFELLNKLAFEYRSTFPDSAIYFAQQALDLNKKLNLKIGPATSLNCIGLANYYKGNLVRAFENYEKAEQQAHASGDSVELGYALNNTGRLFAEQGMLTQSYPYFVRAESLFKGTNNTSGLAYVYQSFASLYKTEKDFVKSEQSYLRALEIRRELGNTRDIMSGMVLLGKLYMEIGRYDDALRFFERADSSGHAINDALGLAEVKILMAEYYLTRKDTERAKKLAVDGLGYILNFKNVKLVPRGYLVLGEICLAEKLYPAAKQYFTMALNLSERMKYLDVNMQSHYYLWKISEINRDRDAAMDHSNQYLVLKDSVNDIHVSERIAKFQFQVEIEKKQQEYELLKAAQARNETTIKNQDQQRAGLALLALLVSTLLYFQWQNARKRKVANVTLRNHLTTLVEFSKSKVIGFGNTNEAAREIARLTAHSLGVSRISIWRYNEEERTIESQACYELSTGKFLETIKLELDNYPAYHRALKSGRIIDASDARTDPRTREFRENYLVPLNIYSMLDVTFSLDGELDGLICCEHQGAPRVWKSEDIIFSSSVADVICLAYRSAQRREYEKKLKHQAKEIARMNETLELRVKERTEELQNRNSQLTEYAFINSHVLRSPVSKVLGLINLMEVDKSADPKEIINHLKTSCEELDEVVKKITITLDGGENLDRNVFKK